MEEKKQTSILWIFIVAGVITVLIGPLCFYLGTQMVKDNTENNVVNNQSVNNTVNNTGSSSDNNTDNNEINNGNQLNDNNDEENDKAKKLINKLRIGSYLSEEHGYFFRNNVNIKDLSNNIKLLVAYELLENSLIEGKSDYNNISSSDMQKYYSEIFNSVKYPYQPETFTTRDGAGKPIIYNYNSNKQMYESNKEYYFGGGTGFPYYIFEVINTNLSDQVYEIYIKVFYGTSDGYYKTDKETPIEKFNEKNYSFGQYEDFYNKYYDSIETMKFTFEKNGDNYYFESAEHI